jgi:hypothetical protein
MATPICKNRDWVSSESSQPAYHKPRREMWCEAVGNGVGFGLCLGQCEFYAGTSHMPCAPLFPTMALLMD